MKSNTSSPFRKAACPPQAATFRNPLNAGPDPFLTHYQGEYYLTTTQGNAVPIWKSRTTAILPASAPKCRGGSPGGGA